MCSTRWRSRGGGRSSISWPAGERPVNDLVRGSGWPSRRCPSTCGCCARWARSTCATTGRQRLYRLNGAALKPIHDWVKRYERPWAERFDGAGRRARRPQGEGGKDDGSDSSGTAKVTLPDRRPDPDHARVRRAAGTSSTRRTRRPELVRRWWAGSRGEVTIAEIDLRVGGRVALRDDRRPAASRSPSTASTGRSSRTSGSSPPRSTRCRAPTRRGRAAQQRHVRRGRRPHDADHPVPVRRRRELRDMIIGSGMEARHAGGHGPDGRDRAVTRLARRPGWRSPAPRRSAPRARRPGAPSGEMTAGSPAPRVARRVDRDAEPLQAGQRRARGRRASFSPTPAVKTTASTPPEHGVSRRRRTCGSGGSRRRAPARPPRRPRRPAAGPRACRCRRPAPSSPLRWLSSVVDLVDATARPRGAGGRRTAGSRSPRAGAHHQALERGQAHRGVDATARRPPRRRWRRCPGAARSVRVRRAARPSSAAAARETYACEVPWKP